MCVERKAVVKSPSEKNTWKKRWMDVWERNAALEYYKIFDEDIGVGKWYKGENDERSGRFGATMLRKIGVYPCFARIERKETSSERGSSDGRGALVFLEGLFFALSGEHLLNKVEIVGN